MASSIPGIMGQVAFPVSGDGFQDSDHLRHYFRYSESMEIPRRAQVPALTCMWPAGLDFVVFISRLLPKYTPSAHNLLYTTSCLMARAQGLFDLNRHL